MDTPADLVTKRTYIPSLTTFEEDIRRAMGIVDDALPAVSEDKTKTEPLDSSVDKPVKAKLISG